ncbi:CoF synthetase [Aquimarina muelleri]|uniref:CoF synthetase n=1 Tax=Aquimarina muelleri TaxID=279356 RepID=UPI003F685E67
MKGSELFRNKMFWIIDSLKRGQKRKHYNEIKFIVENPTSTKAIYSKKKYLQNILNHTTKSTSYYEKYKQYKSIEDFPVVDKNIIRDNFNDFQSKNFINLPKYKVSTSGSTGTPFKIYQDSRKKNRNIADNIFFSEMAGFKIGYHLTYFRLWNAFEKKGRIARLLQNIEPIDVFDLSNKEVVDTILKKLSKSKLSNSWLGYASAYQEICKYLDQKKSSAIPNNLKSVIAISEKLNDYTKQAMSTYFNTEVISRYSNVENGIIAQQPLGENSCFRINEASYFVEVLEFNSNKRVIDGKLGRIVITDLFNYCMPMIRYDTGDIGIKDIIDSEPVFVKIEGRKIDMIYDVNGKIVSVNLVLIVNKYSELRQSQLIQKAPGIYHFKLNSKDKFLREEEFLNEFKVYLGEEAKITIEYVNEIPLLASGKRRVMVNEMINL